MNVWLLQTCAKMEGNQRQEDTLNDYCFQMHQHQRKLHLQMSQG